MFVFVDVIAGLLGSLLRDGAHRGQGHQPGDPVAAGFDGGVAVVVAGASRRDDRGTLTHGGFLGRAAWLARRSSRRGLATAARWGL
jgi:hypothetical protein